MALPNYNIVLKKLNGKLGPIEMLKFLFYKRKIDEVRLFGLGIKKNIRKKE